MSNVHPHITGRQEPVQPSFLDHKGWVAAAIAAGVLLGFGVMAASDVTPRTMVDDVRGAFEVIVRPSD